MVFSKSVAEKYSISIEFSLYGMIHIEILRADAGLIKPRNDRLSVPGVQLHQ